MKVSEALEIIERDHPELTGDAKIRAVAELRRGYKDGLRDGLKAAERQQQPAQHSGGQAGAYVLLGVLLLALGIVGVVFFNGIGGLVILAGILCFFRAGKASRKAQADEKASQSTAN